MRGPQRRLAAVMLASIAPLAMAGTASWQRIQGGPGTSCAFGDPYYFYGKIESRQKLFVFLGGGGACWDAATCDVRRSRSFSFASDTVRPYQRGLLDDSQDLNPFKDYSFLIVPYCTGDLNLGNRVVEYQRANPEGLAPGFTINHVGARNVRAALRWIGDHVPLPATVVVGGQSGGAPASPWVATLLARQYPSARVVQIGDAAGGLNVPRLTLRLLRHWGADSLLLADRLMQEDGAQQMTFGDLYIAAARVAPNLQLAQVNSADDPTQLSFLNLVGVRSVELSDYLAASMSSIESAVPGFRFFVVEGDKHVFLSSPVVYDAVSESTRLIDWIADLAAGREVTSVGRRLLIPDTTAQLP